MRRRLLMVSVLSVVTLALFWPALDYGFVDWDDTFHVYENPYLNPATLENTLHFWKESYERLYVPVTYTTWSFLAWLSQAPDAALHPQLFHAANIIFHIFNSLLVFSILRIILTHGFQEDENEGAITDDSTIDSAAFLGALLFAVHPIHVEPVAWVTGMKDTLSGFLSLIAVREYLAYAVSSKTMRTGNKKAFASGSFNPDRKYLHYGAASVAFLMAILSKPVAVILPLVALIIDRWIIKRSLRESALPVTAWLLVSAMFAVVAKSVQQTGTYLFDSPVWARPFIAGDAITFYLYKLVWPLQLGIDYGRSPDFVMRHWWFYASWLVPLLLVSAIYFSKKREPFLASAGIIVVSLLPLLGFVQFFIQHITTVSDHYFYFPFLGVSILISWLYFNHISKPVTVIAFVIICLLGVRSYQQIPTWKDEDSLFANALKVNPRSVITLNNVGRILAEQNKPDQAIARYEKALKIRPDYEAAHYNLGVALTEQNKLDEAVSHYKEAIKILPDDAKVYMNLGAIYVTRNNLDEAIAQFEKAVQIQPGYAKAHSNLGATLAGLGKYDEAIPHYQIALKIRPNLANTHYGLGVALAKNGKFDDAIVEFKKALSIKPGLAPWHYRLGLVLAQQGRLEEAVTHYAHALSLNPGLRIVKRQLQLTEDQLKRTKSPTF